MTLLLFAILAFNGVTRAQFSCPDPARCTSKDLEVVDAFIEGVDLCNTCTPGTTVTKNLFVKIANKTGSERTSFAVFAHLVGGTFTSSSPGGASGTSISFCDGPIPPNSTITTLAGTITFKCGDELKLTDVFEAWTSAADAHNSCSEILADKCASIAPKCGTLSELVIRTPLAVKEESHTDVLCFGGKTGSIDISVTGGTPPYTYSWSNGATTQDISGLAAGDYTVTVTDANKCTATLKVTIKQPTELKLSETHTNVACFGGKTGSIDLSVTGGVSPYTYSWSNGATTQDISELAAGDYTVTVTDANKCTQTLKVTITQASEIKLTETHIDVACNGGKTGSIDLSVTGGVSPYTYSWSNGATTQDISSLAAGDYTVTVTDANKCTATLKVTIKEASSIKITETHTNVACNGGNTGSIDITVTGGTPPYTYSWTNGATSQDISGLKAGDYTVTVTDANKCTASLKVTITEASSIKLTETHTNVSCNGGNNGSIDLTVTGGTAPFTYSWSNGATTQDISGLAAGDYTVTVTDANKCTATLKVTITQPALITCTLTAPATLPTCGSTGNTLTAATSVSGVTYLWSVTGTGWTITGGQGTATITYTAGSNGSSGVFTLKVTKDGCSSTCTVTFGCKANIVQGCTPGFWKNSPSYWNQATDAVSACIASAAGSPYNGNGTTQDLFRTTFGLTADQMIAVGLNPNMTLQDAINLGGGNCYKLARHSVAALLSSCGLKFYTYTTAQVLKMTHDAIASKTCEPTASKLAAANEAGSCPLRADGNAVTANQLAEPGATIEEVTKLSVNATPNPYYTRIRFEIHSPVSGNGTLELYNLIGQRLNVVFQGHVDAGKTKTVEYSVPSPLRTDLIYRMSVGTQSTTGKLIQGQR